MSQYPEYSLDLRPGLVCHINCFIVWEVGECSVSSKSSYLTVCVFDEST